MLPSHLVNTYNIYIYVQHTYIHSSLVVSMFTTSSNKWRESQRFDNDAELRGECPACGKKKIGD
jgi:hypothetical protein